MRPTPNIQVANCERKLRWSDEPGARAAVSLFVGLATGGKLWVYRCPTCRGWHCTKKDHGTKAIVEKGKPYAD